MKTTIATFSRYGQRIRLQVGTSRYYIQEKGTFMTVSNNYTIVYIVYTSTDYRKTLDLYHKKCTSIKEETP